MQLYIQGKMRFYWMRMGLEDKSNVTGVLMRRGKFGSKDKDRREKSHVKTEANIGVMHLQVKKS
jgi:hypothetical protein